MVEKIKYIYIHFGLLLADFLPISWHRRHGVHPSSNFFLQICLLAFLMAMPMPIQMEQIESSNAFSYGIGVFSPSRHSTFWTCGNKIDIDILVEDLHNQKSYRFCYISVLSNEEIFGNLFGAKFSRRFKMTINANVTQKMCGDCNKCSNKTGIKLHEFEWKTKNSLKMRSSYSNGTEMDMATYIKKYFYGNNTEFLMALLMQTGCIRGGIQINRGAMIDGAFIEDLFDANYLLALHMDLSLSFSYLEKYMEYQNVPGICVAGKSSIFNKAKMESCRRKVENWNTEYGYNKYEVSEYACLMNGQEKRIGGAIPTPNVDNVAMEWGGHTAHGELEIPEEESAEEERKRMRKWGTVKRKELGPLLRVKREVNEVIIDGDVKPEAECAIIGLDITEKWPKCEQIIHDIRDQGICNSSWAVSTAAALMDRSCIFLSKKISAGPGLHIAKNRYVSARDAMECSGKAPIKGGNMVNIWKYYVDQSTVNEKCKPYIDNSPRNDWSKQCHYQCDSQTNPDGSLDLLEWRDPNQGARDLGAEQFNAKEWTHLKRYAAILYRPTHYYVLHANKFNERLMKKELDANGTIVAGMYIYDYDEFNLTNTRADTTTIYRCPLTGGNPVDYISVRIIGYGQIDCLGEIDIHKFWLVANSRGNRWGNKGMFKIARGNNECGIESDISWGQLTAYPYDI